VADLGLDGFEQTALAIMRHFFASFAHPACQGWLRAARVAETCFEAHAAGGRLLELLGVVQAMRLARRTPFAFSNPDCACCAMLLTPAERHLMLALQAARRGQRGVATAQALMLCEGAVTADLLDALAALPRAGSVCMEMPSRMH
jgi:hypothetical protein